MLDSDLLTDKYKFRFVRETVGLHLFPTRLLGIDFRLFVVNSLLVFHFL